MTARQVATVALAVLALGACRKKQQPPAAGPLTTTDADAARRERERALADSIAEANARRERERRLLETTERARDLLLEPVYFEFDSETLSAEAEDRLRTKAEVLRANPEMRIRVEGHADERGSTEYNLALGQRRAESIRSYLANYGISPDRITVLSYGEERPADEGGDEAALARNRRAEFVLTSGGAR